MSAGSGEFVIAIVDDDQAVLRSLQCLLESADFEVRLFSSGVALLESGCLTEIDCLVSDLDMPGLDGFQLMGMVHTVRPGLPIILITGYPETLQRLPPIAADTVRCFTKPFQGAQLLAAIDEGLRNPPR